MQDRDLSPELMQDNVCHRGAAPEPASADRGSLMRFLLGVAVGILLVVGFSYAHDTGRVKVGPKDPFVNWGTVMGILTR